jgi:hypothetical protein
VYSRSSDAESCPDQDAMQRAVATRFGYDPFFAWAKEIVVVQIWRGGSRYRSRVQVVDMQGIARGTRELSSDRDACAELFDATALAISIALDASAQKEADIVPPPPAPETPPVPPAPPPPPTPPTDEPAPERARRAPATPALRVFAGADLLGSAGTAPSLTVGGAAFVGLRMRSLSAAIEARVDAPGSSDGGRITSWLFAAGLAPCVHIGPGSACLLASLGQVRASGSEVSAPSQGTALFAVVGARLGAELPLTEVLFLRVHADLLLDLDPLTVRLNNNDAEEWQAPIAAATLGAGLFVRFP